MAYRRILVPVDGSAASAKGLAEAVRLAREGRARLRLLHVVDTYAAVSVPEIGAASVGPVLEAIRAAGRKLLARAERAPARAGLKAETALVEAAGGRVADAIVEEAKRWRADLIVMGTHGRRGVGRMLMGSDAELVVRYSAVPVLLVPARAAG
ncbi:MAG: universal stress protein [Burkholderiales bacterium]|nr:universal stress protein [Burkholderiales bacterium]